MGTQTKDQEHEAESSQKATQTRSRTKTPPTPLHQCSRHSGHFSHDKCHDQTGSRTAFLHAPIAKDHDGKQRDVYLWTLSTTGQNLATKESHVWTTQFTKSMAGLEVLQKLSFVRLTSEASVCIMVYVDDLLVLGDKTTVDSTFEAMQKQVLLKHISYLEPGKPQQLFFFFPRGQPHVTAHLPGGSACPTQGVKLAKPAPTVAQQERPGGETKHDTNRKTPKRDRSPGRAAHMSPEGVRPMRQRPTACEERRGAKQGGTKPL